MAYTDISIGTIRLEKASEFKKVDQPLVLETVQPDFNLTDLNHDMTSNELLELNIALFALLIQDNVTEKAIQALVYERSQEVERILDQSNDIQKREFASLESPVNELIMTHINKLKDTVQKSLGKVSKASKAIKKYRQR